MERVELGLSEEQVRWLDEIAVVAGKVQGRKVKREELLREALAVYVDSYRGVSSFLRRPLYRRMSERKKAELSMMVRNQRSIFGESLVKELCKKNARVSAPAKRLRSILEAHCF